MRGSPARSPGLLHAPGLFFLLALAISALIDPHPANAPESVPVFPVPAASLAAPALPIEPAAIPTPTGTPTAQPVAPAAAPTLAPSPTPEPARKKPAPRKRLKLKWRGVDFNNGSPEIQFTIGIASLAFSGGWDVPVTVRSGWPCEFWDFRACVGVQDDGKNGVILITVHSGIGGDGQALRHALEGTGFNRAALSLEEIHHRMEQIRGAVVTLRQGDVEKALRVLSVERIPPAALDAYFSSSPLEALRSAATSSKALKKALKTGAPLIVIETCGWRHPEEWDQHGATDTTGSVYLLVMGE